MKILLVFILILVLLFATIGFKVVMAVLAIIGWPLLILLVVLLLILKVFF